MTLQSFVIRFAGPKRKAAPSVLVSKPQVDRNTHLRCPPASSRRSGVRSGSMFPGLEDRNWSAGLASESKDPYRFDIPAESVYEHGLAPAIKGGKEVLIVPM
ncbi:uncharacterized protein H6S33_012331 [Morchella sextelata]|jgi:hypothetical protein|uniref:uncharacterized protein n=1 Tax=Morchella sextelata TaxID=1174677 RepID=UPI001D03DB24|nr:uncharacterized protein H6S33_012331 [Morchella sextelata]KAH0609785.1 hypothetical protein H6S33_012331 [Morchella sextelata]